jgi:hypothetical protein
MMRKRLWEGYVHLKIGTDVHTKHLWLLVMREFFAFVLSFTKRRSIAAGYIEQGEYFKVQCGCDSLWWNLFDAGSVDLDICLLAG